MGKSSKMPHLSNTCFFQETLGQNSMVSRHEVNIKKEMSNVATQTDDSGCVHGCTSMYISPLGTFNISNSNEELHQCSDSEESNFSLNLSNPDELSTSEEDDDDNDDDEEANENEVALMAHVDEERLPVSKQRKSKDDLSTLCDVVQEIVSRLDQVTCNTKDNESLSNSEEPAATSTVPMTIDKDSETVSNLTNSKNEENCLPLEDSPSKSPIYDSADVTVEIGKTSNVERLSPVSEVPCPLIRETVERETINAVYKSNNAGSLSISEDLAICNDNLCSSNDGKTSNDRLWVGIDHNYCLPDLQKPMYTMVDHTKERNDSRIDHSSNEHVQRLPPESEVLCPLTRETVERETSSLDDSRIDHRSNVHIERLSESEVSCPSKICNEESCSSSDYSVEEETDRNNRNKVTSNSCSDNTREATTRSLPLGPKNTTTLTARVLLKPLIILPNKPHLPNLDDEEKPHLCDKCPKAFNKKSTLRRHILIHTGEKPHRCRLCEKAFSDKGNLSQHLKVHSGDKPYKCKLCKWSFSRAPDLTRHERTHTGHRPYKCEDCGKTFTQIGTLKQHEQIHSGKKPFKCQDCNKSFTLKSNLVVHQRTHTGEKPFKCCRCGKTFSQKATLREHQLLLHKRKKEFNCSSCSGEFNTKRKLTYHQHTCHSN